MFIPRHNVLRSGFLPGVHAMRWISKYPTPTARLSSLRQLMDQQQKTGEVIRVMEVHSGLSALIAENARGDGGQAFHAVWSSSLTSSSIKGKPDIETVDTSARIGVVEDVLEVCSLPMIYDGDTGGHPEVFHFTVRSLERLGVSACIIEDKTGLKQNSLFGTDRKQVLEDIDTFCKKIEAGKKAQVRGDAWTPNPPVPPLPVRVRAGEDCRCRVAPSLFVPRPPIAQRPHLVQNLVCAAGAAWQNN